jgi:erythromycin esterase-like protein
LGDARATEVSQQGEFNLGQLVRERYEKRSKLVGFTTFAGSVTAAADWDEPAERKRVRPALGGSFEELFHEVGVPNFFLPLDDTASAESEEQMEGALLPKRRLERAIGVIYRPETERWSHYFNANLGEQFDGVIHIDQTRALEPLERTAGWDTGEVPETFPSGI